MSVEAPSEPPAQSGVVFRSRGELHFLPATIALKVLPAPEVARVPGAPSGLLGVALVEGDMIPIVAADPEGRERVVPKVDATGREAVDVAAQSSAMIVCTCLGELLGLVGVDVVATGRFESAKPAEHVVYHGETARVFDVGALIAKVRDGRWAV